MSWILVVTVDAATLHPTGNLRNFPGKFRLLEFDYIGSLFTPATLCHMHMLEHCCYWCWMSLWMLRHWILPEHFRNFPGKFRLLELDDISSSLTPATLCYMYISEHYYYWCWMSHHPWMLQLWILLEHFRNVPGKFLLFELDVSSSLAPATLWDIYIPEYYYH